MLLEEPITCVTDISSEVKIPRNVLLNKIEFQWFPYGENWKLYEICVIRNEELKSEVGRTILVSYFIRENSVLYFRKTKIKYYSGEGITTLLRWKLSTEHIINMSIKYENILYTTEFEDEKSIIFIFREGDRILGQRLGEIESYSVIKHNDNYYLQI